MRRGNTLKIKQHLASRIISPTISTKEERWWKEGRTQNTQQVGSAARSKLVVGREVGRKGATDGREKGCRLSAVGPLDRPTDRTGGWLL